LGRSIILIRGPHGSTIDYNHFYFWCCFSHYTQHVLHQLDSTAVSQSANHWYTANVFTVLINERDHPVMVTSLWWWHIHMLGKGACVHQWTRKLCRWQNNCWYRQPCWTGIKWAAIQSNLVLQVGN